METLEHCGGEFFFESRTCIVRTERNVAAVEERIR